LKMLEKGAPDHDKKHIRFLQERNNAID
jgi:hypothetical protein